MGRPAKYPWAAWLADEPGTLHVDRAAYGDVGHQALQSQVRVEAKKRDLAIFTRECHQHPRCTVVRRLAGAPARRYDWDMLLDGKERMLTDDEFISWASFVKQARNKARERKIRVRTKRVAFGGWIQALPR